MLCCSAANQTVDTTQLEMSVLRYVLQTLVLENALGWNLSGSTKRDQAFITKGFTDWRDATKAFKKHVKRSAITTIGEMTVEAI